MPEPLKPDEINDLTKMLGSEGGGQAAAPPPAGPPGKMPVESFEPAPGAPQKEAGMELLDDVTPVASRRVALS